MEGWIDRGVCPSVKGEIWLIHSKPAPIQGDYTGSHWGAKLKSTSDRHTLFLPCSFPERHFIEQCLCNRQLIMSQVLRPFSNVLAGGGFLPSWRVLWQDSKMLPLSLRKLTFCHIKNTKCLLTFHPGSSARYANILKCFLYHSSVRPKWTRQV